MSKMNMWWKWLKWVCVWVCLGIQTGTYNKRNNRVPSWKKAPVCQTCTKHMRGFAKEYKQKRNNGRTPFAGVYKFVWVCVGVYRDDHTLWGHFSIGTIGPRESVLCSQRSSDVIRVQSVSINPPIIPEQWQVAIVVKTSELPVLTVDPYVHTGAFLTCFYCNFDHPEQYKTMLLPVKNGWLILTSKCTYYTWANTSIYLITPFLTWSCRALRRLLTAGNRSVSAEKRCGSSVSTPFTPMVSTFRKGMTNFPPLFFSYRKIFTFILHLFLHLFYICFVC